eukprot:2068590-Amphidinium_carterae.1
MQQGPVVMVPQNCSATSYQQAYVMMPQWTGSTMAGPRWSAPVFSSYSAAPPQQVQHQEPCSKPSKDASLLGGVFGIAGVSQLPAASLASKNKPRKTKGSTLRFAPERKPQKSSTGG